jgi:hypothetical protein
MGSDKPEGGDAPPSRRVPKAQAKRKADALVRDAGIPQNLAWQVATGHLTLNEVLEKLAQRDKVDGLVRRFDLPRSLATQVALGHADLEVVLKKRRMEKHLEDNRDRSFLLEAAASGEPVVLGLHGRRTLKGVVSAVDRYELQVTTRGADAPETIHKLQVKWACTGKAEMNVRKAHKKDKARDADAEPVWKPQDRYGCSDKRLFGYLDDAESIAVVTLEGDRFQGDVTWMGRWEFGLEVRKGSEVTIFRHALADVWRA